MLAFLEIYALLEYRFLLFVKGTFVMRRALGLILGSLLILCPNFALAKGHFEIGGALDALFPLNLDMYGQGMLDNEWGRVMLDKDFSAGEDRAVYPTPNRPSMIYSPVLIQRMKWDNGFGLELSEGFSFLHFWPNKEADVSYERFMLPIKLGATYTLNRNGRWRPFAGAGVSVTYVSTHIEGKDLQDQWVNENFGMDTSDDEDSGQGGIDDAEYENRQREIDLMGWYSGFFAMIGTDVMLKDDLALSICARYESVVIDGVDAKLIEDDQEQWHWKEDRIRGDAGGIGVFIGVIYRIF